MFFPRNGPTTTIIERKKKSVRESDVDILIIVDGGSLWNYSVHPETLNDEYIQSA